MSTSPVGRIWLALPWLVLACGIPLIAWWLLEPTPIEITYVAPSFLSQPVDSREDAAQHYIAEAVGGTVVWRYVEYCVRRPYEGTSRRAWVGEALVWHAPDLPTQFSRAPGCARLSIAVPLPQSSPSRSFNFVQRMEVVMNPLRTEEVIYPPIPLRILDAKDCKQ
jgi:hypothetical protein